jgi:hypothetical protein
MGHFRTGATWAKWRFSAGRKTTAMVVVARNRTCRVSERLMLPATRGKGVVVQTPSEIPIMLYEIDILNGAMVLMDQDGNSCECHALTTYGAAKRTIQRWVEQYSLNVADAYRLVLDHFLRQ